MTEPYTEGDTYSYQSVTTFRMVTWTRDADGAWHASDDRGGTATDDDIKHARYQDQLEKQGDTP